MIESLHRCEHCGYAVLTKYEDEAVKLRSEIVIWREDRCTVICRSCKKEIEIEIAVPASYLKKEKIKHVIVDKDRRIARRRCVNNENGENIESK